MKRRTLSELEDIKLHHRYGGYRIPKLLKIVKESAYYANKRRNKSLEILEREELPVPNAYRRYSEQEKDRGYSSWLDVNFNLTENDLKGSEQQIIQKLRNKFAQNMNFLSTKTSTVKGWKETLRGYEKNLVSQSNLNTEETKRLQQLFKDNFDLVWKSYNKIEQAFADREITGSSDVMISQITKLTQQYSSADEVFMAYKERYEELEEEEIERLAEKTPRGVNLMADFAKEYQKRKAGKKMSVKPLGDN